MTKYICKQCKNESEIPDCVTCGSWMCPDCKTMNDIVAAPEPGEDWLGGCIPFAGIGVDQTTGVIGLPANIFVEDLVKSVIIFDDETEDGLKTILKKDLKKTDKIANLKFWEARIPAGIQVIDVNGKAMSREDWYNSLSPVTGEPRHTDGLAIWAAKKLRTMQTGGGVQAHPI
jgi:hypothetical protein